MGFAAAFLAAPDLPDAGPELPAPLPMPALPFLNLAAAVAAGPAPLANPLPEPLLNVFIAVGAALLFKPPTRVQANTLLEARAADGFAEGSRSPRMSSSRSSAPLASTCGAAAGL